MCGRFTLTIAPTGLGDLFGIGWSSPFRPHYSIAPGQELLAVRTSPHGPEWTRLRWGLIPHWAKDEKIAWRTINARSETVETTASFRSAFRARRCLIPADGYYEWQKTGASKQPWHIRLPGGPPFAFAGLWEEWQGPERTLSTCTILTTSAAPAVASIHERMPIILEPEGCRSWLDPALHEVTALKQLLMNHQPARLESRRVSILVNTAQNDRPECLESVQS